MFLDTLKISVPESDNYPYNIPVIKNGIDIQFTKPVSFIVGENGSGKSTIIETIASKCGYNLSGGNKNHFYEDYRTEANLYDFTILSWYKKPFDGFFLRAESFYNFAEYIDKMGDNRVLDAYGGKSLHKQSHGESFLSLFSNKFDRGFFILDEPEAALSPMRLLSLISIIKELENNGNVQFIIATHSPMLLCYPNAEIFNIENGIIEKKNYNETEHFQLTKNFLNNPDVYLHELFKVTPTQNK